MRTTLFLMILTLSATGCGYKGPLYLPKDKPVAAKPAPAPSAPTSSASTPSP